MLRISASDYIGWSLIRTGAYEPRTLQLALELMVSNGGGTFIDVGANVGLYSLAVGSIENTSVVAIEADCSNGAELRKNIEKNQLPIRIFSGAVGRASGFASMQWRSSNNSGSAFTASAPTSDIANGTWVPVARLDDVFEAVASDLPRPYLMKLDIEGSERDALEGLDFMGRYRPRNIIIELNDLSNEAWGGYNGFCKFFDDHGYDLYLVTGERLSPGLDLVEDNVWARERQLS
jgi:FkbM family methyltransferase